MGEWYGSGVRLCVGHMYKYRDIWKERTIFERERTYA